MNQEYAARRKRVFDAIGDGCLILFSPQEKVRSNDTLYPYRQSSDFLYLTGFDEPESVLVLRPNHPEHPYSLFVRPRDPEREIWDGYRSGPEGAVRDHGADAAWSITELDARLPDLVAGASAVHHAWGDDPEQDARIIRLARSLAGDRKKPERAPRAIIDPRPLLHRMRLLKSPDELDLMARAAEISALGHLRAIQQTQPGWHEYQTQALIEQTFRSEGANGPAYNSIVAGGANACVLHYDTNRQPLKDGDLVLIDAGAEFAHYAGDITRTWPIGPRFTGAQRDLYAVVLEAQKAAVDRVRANTTNHDIHQATIRDLTDGLRQLGLLDGDLDGLIESGAFKKYFMHGTGHYIGMDVHDVGPYYRAENEGIPLEPGAVLTIEPGLYVPADDQAAPEAMRGVGIRIEDDVVVTDNAPRVLTTGVPKEISELEELRAAALANA